MRRIGFLLTLLSLFAACGSNRSETVTGIESTAHISIVMIATTSHAIQKARLLFDGREIAAAEPAGGAAQITLNSRVDGVQRGPHVIKVVIDRQATTPTGYTVGGSVTTTELVLDLAPVHAVLSTGEAVEMRITL